MNSIVLLGRTTASIELKQTQTGKSVAGFTLAVKRPYAKDTTDFIDVVCWEKKAEIASKYVKKGDQVCVRGSLTTRSYQDKQGNKRTAFEVIADELWLIGSKADIPPAEQTYMPPSYASTTPKFEDVKDDDLPF